MEHLFLEAVAAVHRTLVPALQHTRPLPCRVRTRNAVQHSGDRRLGGIAVMRSVHGMARELMRFSALSRVSWLSSATGGILSWLCRLLVRPWRMGSLGPLILGLWRARAVSALVMVISGGVGWGWHLVSMSRAPARSALCMHRATRGDVVDHWLGWGVGLLFLFAFEPASFCV